MQKPKSMKALEELGRTRLSKSFFIRDFLEIQFSDDILEKVKLNSKIFSQVMTLIVKGEKETAAQGKEIIEVSWRIINKPIAILDINF